VKVNRRCFFLGDCSGFLKEVDDPLYDIIGGYDGKLFPQKDGSFARPLPSKTDKYTFGEESLVITQDELSRQYTKKSADNGS